MGRNKNVVTDKKISNSIQSGQSRDDSPIQSSEQKDLHVPEQSEEPIIYDEELEAIVAENENDFEQEKEKGHVVLKHVVASTIKHNGHELKRGDSADEIESGCLAKLVESGAVERVKK